MAVVVHLGDCFDVLPTLPDESVHAVVCDPPYGINFMGKAWDGKAIEEAAARPVPLAGVERLTGSPDSPTRKLTARTGSAFANRAGEAGAYDFTLRGNRAFQQWVQQWGVECLRVLKPGGHLLSFGGTRTYHRLAAGLEDAGFEIRDCLCWMFGSGFPKSLDVAQSIDKAARGVPQGGSDPTSPNHGRFKTQATEGKRDETDAGQGYGAGPGAFMAVAGDRAERGLVEPAKEWEGWGTALKPAFEPVVLARKPLVGTVAANVLAHGTGALNVDACRIGENAGWSYPNGRGGEGWHGRESLGRNLEEPMQAQEGRWPANVVLDEDAAAMLDKQTGTLTSGSEPDAGFVRHAPGIREGVYGGGKGLWKDEQEAGSLYGDSGGASRFFYCAKVSRAERNAGCDGFDPRMMRWSSGDQSPGTFQSEGTDKTARNHHPTVKPVALMRWLVRLVTPPGGTVLDPFTGSGSTGIAAALEGFDFIGIEREADYHRIAEARIAWWLEHGERALDVARVAEREKPPEDQQSIYSELA